MKLRKLNLFLISGIAYDLAHGRTKYYEKMEIYLNAGSVYDLAHGKTKNVRN
jgi:hypothetical protein